MGGEDNMNESGRSKVRQLLTNPWIGGASLVLASISIIVAVYFGVRSTARRELAFTQEKPSILVFDPGLTSAFDLTPQSLVWSRSGIDPISEKVYVVSFAIWNTGRLSVKPEHVLKPLRIQVGDEVKQPIAIWEVRPSSWSREEIKMKITGDVVEENGLPQIPIGFRILEPGDGASFQVIYSGPEDIDVSLWGTVEGITRDNFFLRRKFSPNFFLLTILYFAILAISVAVRRLRLRGLRHPNILKLVMQAGVFFIMLLILFTLVSKNTKLIELAEIPIFEYKPSIVDLRQE